MAIDINKTYRTQDGREVRIYATDGGGRYPIHGAILSREGWDNHTWTEDGQFQISSPENCIDLIEFNPLNDLQIDDKVFVRDIDDEDWNPGYFAGISEDGLIEVFQNGATSWSAEGRTTEWSQWRLP